MHSSMNSSIHRIANQRNKSMADVHIQKQSWQGHAGVGCNLLAHDGAGAPFPGTEAPTTTRVTVKANGAETNEDHQFGVASRVGHGLAFESDVSDLGPGIGIW